jgi:beta-mannosidase
MKCIDLHGTWSASIRDREIEMPFEVPGDLAHELLRNGHIEDPFYARNELDIQWIGKTDWSLSRTFELESVESPAYLRIRDLDTVAQLYINGLPAGSCSNMFAPADFEISALLQPGENRIEIRFESPEAAAQRAASELPYPIPFSKHFEWASPHRNLIRKIQCHGGWDWGPSIMTGGIYGDAFLEIGGEGRIEYFNAIPVLRQSGEWEISCELTYRAFADGEISVSWEFDGSAVKSSHSVQQGVQTISRRIHAGNPELWWPAGMGRQTRYAVAASVVDRRVERQIGFRRIEVITEDDERGRSMFFRVNGRDLFAKGANWIPVDALPGRERTEDYRRLLEDAVDANMNMIRLWGGGRYERDAFYELCDELGLLIWHDMMFACALYPATEAFLENVRPEIEHQILRLKSHSSIAIWCGNNEDLGAITWYEESRNNRARYLVDYDRLNEGLVGKTIKRLDPSRTWWPSSPSAGEGDYSDNWHDDSKGDMHYWSVWHEGLPFEAYYDVTPRFCSEFGFQSFPSLRGVESFAPPEERNLTSPIMRFHQRNDRGNTIILSTMASYFRMPSDFGDSLYLSQVQQAYAIRTAVDYWRSRRPVSMGALYWQLNDNWPVASWSSIEYSGDWKLLHYEARRFFAPIGISAFVKDGSVQVFGLNDRPDEISGTLVIRRMSFQGDTLEESYRGNASCPGDGAVLFWSAELPEESERNRSFLDVRWEPDGAEAVERSMLFAKPLDCYFEPAKIKLEAGEAPGEYLISCEAPGFFVSLESPVPGRFSDAGFTLLPGQVRGLSFIPSRDNDTSKPPEIADIIIRDLRATY